MKRLSARWTKDIKSTGDLEGAVQFEGVLRQQLESVVFKRMRAILEEELVSIDRSSISSNMYDNPNWAYKQAHNIGRKQQIVDLLELITPTKEV